MHFITLPLPSMQLKINGQNQWSRSGTQGNKWLPAKVVLDSSDAKWVLTLESKLGDDHENIYVAIDDVLYYDMSCENVTVSFYSSIFGN